MDTRLAEIHQWLRDDLKLVNYQLEPASADASFRRYFRLSIEGNTLIIMDAPPEKEDCSPYIDITQRLIRAQVNAPEVKAHSPDKGFLLLTDLGKILYLDKLTEANADALYTDAIDALIRMQTQAETSHLPDYDAALLDQEMKLFRDWLLIKHLRLTPPDWLDDVFTFLRHAALEQPRVFVHRDYHSRNLTWLPKNSPGILDFQDAVVGPVTYDLVSLLRDCYICWPDDRVLGWIDYYLRQANASGLLVKTSRADLKCWFDLMGIQRHLKASGIFARLWHRDGKCGYLKEIPRTLNYIMAASQHYPELKELEHYLIRQVIPAINNKERAS